MTEATASTQENPESKAEYLFSNWTRDPQLIEDLVDLFEARKRPNTGEIAFPDDPALTEEDRAALRHYTYNEIRKILFSDPARTPWAAPYTRASLPGKKINSVCSETNSDKRQRNTFNATVSKWIREIREGEHPFIPKDHSPETSEKIIALEQRLLAASKIRDFQKQSEERPSDWTNPERLLAAGLTDYCQLTDESAARLLSRAFNQEVSAFSVAFQRRSN